jgi:hypothetical protein
MLNGVFDNPLVIKHLTKLAEDSDEYTAKLELNTAEGEAYSTRLKIGNIFKKSLQFCQQVVCFDRIYQVEPLKPLY